MSFRTQFVSLLLIMALLIPCAAVQAVPPSPEAKAKFIADGTWPQIVADLKAFDAAQDPDMYERSANLHLDRYKSKLALSADAVDTVRVAVILVDFPDFHYDADSYPIPGGDTLFCNIAGTPAMFDSILFSQRGIDAVSNPTGSMTEWYLENSYGSYFIQGDVFGWYRAPNNYSDYVGDNNGMGGGALLASDAVKAADADGVDFSPYGNGGYSVPGVIIIHAGPGAEEGAYGIWSHRSSMYPGVSTDGVSLSGYTMQPEERHNQASLVHMGVFCHEWGHILGAVDWYDISYTPGSVGLGKWCIMSGGSWNNGGRTPAHFNCWTKYRIGFGEMQWLTENYPNAPIPQAEFSPTAYCLRQNPVAGGGGEFWFVENRQQVGFDEFLPGHGLLIYHFDGSAPNNTDPYHYRLAVEEADGRRDLAFNGSSGQDSDPFPGTWNNRTFHAFTVPDSRTNAGEVTEVSVLNVSDSDSIMYADLNVFYAMPYLILVDDSLTATDDPPGGNGDGNFEQGETVEMYLEVKNIMRNAFWPTLHLDVDNPNVEILQNDQGMGSSLNPVLFRVTNTEPIIFHIPDDFVSAVAHFTFTITSDSAFTGGHDRAFTNTFEFDITLGSATAVEDNTTDNLLPTSFALDQNYPNPFNPSTTISYSIEAGQVGQTNLAIFNVLGQKVATLVDQVQGPGYYSVEWSGRGADGSPVASGIYFYRLTNGDRSETRKLMLLK
ncbi:MAG: M6 family metalloprotease domain-containing protein [candidate division Zixibacteria bacterium]|nr:M6 family metalloprotease domain-containing protein [candidate division Zixibacteria bacterium]